MPLFFVTKRDNTIEIFDRDKLIRGLTSAVKKRPVDIESINRIADSVESYYASQMKTEITTEEIGEIALKALKEIDSVAYVRFASVYKDFGDVESFISIISELKEKDSIQGILEA